MSNQTKSTTKENPSSLDPNKLIQSKLNELSQVIDRMNHLCQVLESKKKIKKRVCSRYYQIKKINRSGRKTMKSVANFGNV